MIFLLLTKKHKQPSDQSLFFLQDRIKFPFLTTVALTVPEQENTEAHQKFSSIKIQFHTRFHKALLKCLRDFFYLHFNETHTFTLQLQVTESC